jgi:very-short-patch-repair endonuclease
VGCDGIPEEQIIFARAVFFAPWLRFLYGSIFGINNKQPPPFEKGRCLKGGGVTISIMPRIKNLFVTKQVRKSLRKNTTPQEAILWSRLRRSELGIKFRRQHAFGKYIVDFYCPALKLVIEIDGSQHEDNQNYDTERTKYLESFGIRVLRFWNNEINKNIDGVMLKIQEYISSTPSQSPP